MSEGFVEARSGSGSYVRQRPERQRLTRSWYTDREAGSPFRAQTTAAGHDAAWESSTERVPMTPAVAERLKAAPDDPAIRTRYTFLSDGEPVMLSTSSRPASLTEGTAIMYPEEGPHAGKGVIDRMTVIGQQITHAEESVTAPALAAEAERLRIRPGSTVLTIARVYYTDERPVETANIVMPVERYALVYEIPVALDVVISNCVINLSTDKPRVLAEAFRVLRPGGRLGVSDVIADEDTDPVRLAGAEQRVGCVNGALTQARYRDLLLAAGFTGITITPTHQAEPGLHSAIIQAAKPASQ